MRWRIEAAWPARYYGEKGLFGAPSTVQLVTMDEHDGERYARTARHMREAAQLLMSELSVGSVARFCAISPDKTSGDTRPFPFTHHMVVDEQDWNGPRDWLVVLVDESEAA
jgi:hypothetical protein